MKKLYCDICGDLIEDSYFGYTDGTNENHFHLTCVDFKPYLKAPEVVENNQHIFLNEMNEQQSFLQ